MSGLKLRHRYVLTILAVGVLLTAGVGRRRSPVC